MKLYNTIRLITGFRLIDTVRNEFEKPLIVPWLRIIFEKIESECHLEPVALIKYILIMHALRVVIH